MSRSIEVRNPRNGKFDYVIIPPPERLLVQKCNRLRRGQKNWQEIGLEIRIAALQEWKQALISTKDKLSDALVADTGRWAVSQLEIDSFLASIDYWCEVAPKILRSHRRQRTSVRFIQLEQTEVPYQLVGVISPWSFPLMLSTMDTIPALVAGSAVIVKPSEITPRFMTPLLTALNTVPILRDVLNFVEGGRDTGSVLIECVDFLCFTGNASTGLEVATSANKQFIPACLELGGKNPAIILESADLDLATSSVLWGSVFNSGQSCHSLERIYVAESIYDKFYHQLVAKAHRLKFSYPELSNGDIGPIIAEKQAVIIEKHLQDALERGAIIHCGGEVEELGGGWWCHPTVITGVNHSMKIMVEETFGPIIPVMPFSQVEEAIDLANDSLYGLSGAVFAETEAEALEVAGKLNLSAVSINDAALSMIIQEGEQNPFRFSGMGSSRTGIAALQRFLRKKALFVKTKLVANPWWFDGD